LDGVVVVLVFISFFLLYFSVLPERLTWENYGGDGGDFMSAILTGGIPHPTGYPTYVILGSLFQRILSVKSPYYRVALLSAISGSSTVALMCIWVKRELTSRGRIKWVSGLITALACGTSYLFWSQAVIVEVHGLHAVFIIMALFYFSLITRYSRSRVHDAALMCLAAIFGIGLGNHVTLVFIAPALVGAVILSRKSGMGWKIIICQLLCLLLGLSVYLYLPLSARNYPPINWGNPQNLDGFIWQISGTPYQANLILHEPVNIFNQFLEWAKFLLEQIGLPGVILCILGVVESRQLGKSLFGLLVWVLGIYSLFSIIYNVHDSASYLMPVVMVVSIWVGLGAGLIYRWRWRRLPVGITLVILCVVYFVIRIPATCRRVDPRNEYKAAAYAEDYLGTAPEGAILLTRDDADTFPLWYYHFGLGYRPDVRIIVTALTPFEWYRETLVRTYPDVNYPPLYERVGYDWEEELVSLNSARPICRSIYDSKTSYGIGITCTKRD